MPFVWVNKAAPPKKVRRPKVTVTYKQLEAMGKQMGAATQVSLSNGITAFKKRIPKAKIAEAFATGDYMAVLGLIPWEKLDDDVAGVVGKSIGRTVDKAAGIQIGKLPPNVNKKLRFDAENPQIRTFLRNRTADLITRVSGDARTSVREVIASSFRVAQTPRALAERIKGSIGLLPAHEVALANYRAGLVEAGKSAKEVERLGDKYEADLIDYRAMMIARTETKAAMINGQLSVWRQGVHQGLIDRETATKEWVVSGAPCDICEDLDGTQVGLDDSFDVGGDSVDGPPGHPNCMCSLELHFGETSEDETED
jgi:hypothetical protein